MVYDREDRRAISTLRGAGAQAFELIEGFEMAEIVSVPELCLALGSTHVNFVGISCPKGDDSRREIEIARHGFFERRKLQRTAEFLDALRGIGKSVHLTIFIEDFEFRRVWGWTESQQQLTETCEWQVYAAGEEGLIPPGVEIKLWSSVEAESMSLGATSYDEALLWASLPSQARVLDGIVRIRQEYKKNRGVKLSDLRASSTKAMAGHSLFGEALEHLYPDPIVFIDSADPKRDHLLGLRRKKPLPIIHPWR